MTQEKYNELLLHLLITTQAEVQTLRDFIIGYITKTENMDREATAKSFKAMTDESKRTIMAQIKAHYDSDFDVDDLLNGIFT